MFKKLIELQEGEEQILQLHCFSPCTGFTLAEEYSLTANWGKGIAIGNNKTICLFGWNGLGAKLQQLISKIY